MRLIEEMAWNALTHAVPPSIATLRRTDDGAEIVLRNGPTLPITVRWAGAGYPRDVDRALRNPPEERQLILAAETFSPGSREILNERGVGWVGTDGSALLDLGGVVYIERQPATATTKARVSGRGGMNWTPSSADVAETVLAMLVSTDYHPGAVRALPLLNELAARSDRSLAAVSIALRDFESQGWIAATTDDAERTRGRRPPRQVNDAGALLDAWAGFERTRSENSRFWLQEKRFHVLHRDPEKIAKSISDVFGSRVVFGGLIAADRIAPYSTGISVVRCHIDERLDTLSLDRLAQSAGLTPTDAGARVVMSFARPPVFTAASLDGGLSIASPIRTYVDLLRDSIRGDEPAEHLRRVAIGF